MLASPRFQHGQIFLGEPLLGLAVARIERIHQAVAESIGIDVERRMDEMRDISPERLISGSKPDRRSQALALDLEPDLAEAIGGELARTALEMDLALENIEGDLPHDRVQHVLDLLCQQRLALLGLRGLDRKSTRLNSSH